MCLRVIGLEACESKEVIAIGINTDVVDGHTGYAERITKEKEFEEQYQLFVTTQKELGAKKLDQKIYYSHSDYVGGMKEATLREMMAKKPEKVVELAVKGMLPKGPLGRQMFTKLHVYAGAEHAHAAQKPEVLTF